MEKLKIYHKDYGWSGSITVIATNKKEARKLMENCENYNSMTNIEEYNIEEGLVFCNLGDS